jgi:hypothetical protein
VNRLAYRLTRPAIAAPIAKIAAAAAVLALAVLTGLALKGDGESVTERVRLPDLGIYDRSVVQEMPEGSRAASVDVVMSPAIEGVPAIRFRVSSGGVRAELSASKDLFREGDEWWFGDVLYVPSSPNRAAGWIDGHHTLMQWKDQGTGSPPLQLDLTDRWPGHGLNLFVVDGTGRARPVVPANRLYDRPIPIQVRVRFSADDARGEYEVWADGRRVVPTVHAATLKPGQYSYFKEGQYGEADDNVVYWHGALRGHSRTAVIRTNRGPSSPD